MGGVCDESTSECACRVLASRAAGRSPAALAGLLRRVGQVVSRAEAVRAEAIAEAERTDAARQEGFTSTTAWLIAVSGEPAPICRSQIAVADALQVMPETRTALAAGEVSASRVRLLADAQALAPEAFARDEGKLVSEAAVASSQQLPQVLAAWKRATDAAAAEAAAARLHTRRALHLSKGWSDMLHLSGDLDPESGLVVLSAIQALADPANLDPSDTRTPAQCRADALVEICRRYQQPQGETSHPVPQITVTIPWNTLQTGKGVVDTPAGPITAEAGRRLACDATISRIILDPEGTPVEAGRAPRVPPPAMRRALALRDQHCTWPGCDRPAHWCDAHHIIHWANGGKTELANLRLLCPQHHTSAHQDGWRPQRE
jgi:hypothetical protein